MREYTGTVAGEPFTVNVIESDTDLATFDMWLTAAGPVLAVDTETTGLDIYSPGFACRLVQLGDRSTAWVFDPRRWAPVIRHALSRRTLVFHNAPFDLLVLNRVGLLCLQDGLNRAIDTRILAHLLDPRGLKDGGVGHKLKDLCRALVDESAKDSEKELKEVFRRELKVTIAEGWKVIALAHPVYEMYAGYDVILAARLYEELIGQIVAAKQIALAGFEHRVQAVTTRMTDRGVLLDVPYTQGLSAELLAESESQAAIAAELGLANVNSPPQTVAALQAEGWVAKTKTKTGAPQADASALEEWDSPLARAILASKQAGKRRSAYAENMLNGRDVNDRVHASIHSLQARTARMSISSPAFQQLPSHEWRIRRCILFDPGKRGGSIDYKAVELRVLAALAHVAKMKAAIAAGEDLHGYTASLIYGPGYTEDDRGLAKIAGLGKVFGGGPDTLSKQTGAPVAKIREALRTYDMVYPEVRTYSRKLMDIAERDGAVVTPFGRRLPVDEKRLYAALNYVVQSTAADILKRALIRCEQAGLDDYLLLPVHDEVLYQAPELEVAEVGAEIAAVMRDPDFHGVPIDTDVESGGTSWGSFYEKYLPVAA